MNAIIFSPLASLISESCPTVYYLQKNQIVYVLHVINKSYLGTLQNDLNLYQKH